VKKSRNLVLETKTETKTVKTEIKSEADSADSTASTKKSTKFVGKVPVNMADEDIKNSFSHYGGIKKFKVVDAREHYTYGNDVALHAMLNQTNIGMNNNKYYLIQVLQQMETLNFFSFFRWGRVGKIAGTTLKTCGSLASAVEVLETKFTDKTKNDFTETVLTGGGFEKYPNKYELIEVDYGCSDDDDVESEIASGSDSDKENVDQNSRNSKKEAKSIKKEATESNLDPELQAFLKLICDLKRMEAQVKEMNFDTKRSPLGKVKTDQIKKGYEILTEIEERLRGKNKTSSLVQLTSQYYTKIPHDFGMRVPPVIRDIDMLKNEILLLETLADIEIVTKLVKKKKEEMNKLHPLDRNYQELNCKLTAAGKTEVEKIKMLLKWTHAGTHDMYKSIELVKAFKSECVVQNSQSFKKFQGMKRKLLWHGTRVSNIAGILKQGLRIAPPEAPVTGYMFGKGVYFADSASKSANYCQPSSDDNERVIILADVAIGNPMEVYKADYEADKKVKESTEYDSTFGVGRTQPVSEAKFQGSFIPKVGKTTKECVLKDIEVENESELQYNEYVVYDPEQVNIKFVCHIKFKFGEEGDEEEDSLW